MTYASSVDADAGPLTISIAAQQGERPYLTCNEELGTIVESPANRTRDLGVQLVSRSTALYLEWIEGRAEAPGLPLLRETAAAHLALYDALSAATGRTEFKIT